MNSLKSWSESIARKPGCRVPRHAHYTPDLLQRLLAHTGCENGSELNQHYDCDVVGGISIPAPEGYERPDYSRYYVGRELPEGTTMNDFGVCRKPSGFYHFTGMVSPLINAQSVDDIAAYPMPDPTDWPTDGLEERVAAMHANGLFVAGSVGHTYETAWQIRGYEEFLLDLMLQRDMAELLLERITQRNCIIARATAKAGADYLRVGDDVASQEALMFPPTIWRETFKPRLARIVAAGRAENPDLDVWYHSDGNIMEIIPDLIEIGITILNPIQPECMNPFEIFDKFGDKLVLDGTIGTQTVMPFGTPAEVERTVVETIKHCGQAGGLIISPTHIVEPEVPLGNIDALFATCAKYGNGV